MNKKSIETAFTKFFTESNKRKEQLPALSAVAVPFANQMLDVQKLATIEYCETQIAIMNERILVQNNETKVHLLVAQIAAFEKVITFLSE